MRKLIKFVLLTVFGLLLIVIGVVAYFLATFDLNQYKGKITEIVASVTGRELKINGNARVGLSLIPTIEISDVTLSNPLWAKAPYMLKLKKLEVSFALLPLIRKEIVVDKVSLEGPEIFLEEAADGAANWIFARKDAKVPVEKEEVKSTVKTEDANAAAGLLAGLAVDNVSVVDGLVSIVREKAGQSNLMKINKITMSTKGMDEPATGSFDVLVDNNSVVGNFKLGSVNALLNNQPYAVALSGSAYNVNLALDGVIKDLKGDNLNYDFMVDAKNPQGNFGAPETNLKAKVNGSLKKVNTDIALLEVAKNKIVGKVSADISGKIPYVSANLQSDLIDLPSLTAKKTAFKMPALISTANASAMVPDTEIPYDLLSKANVKIGLNVKKLLIEPGMEASDVSLIASLQEGILKVNPLKLGFGGGDVDVNFVVDAKDKTVVLNMTSQKMLLQKLHKEFEVKDAKDFGVLDGGNVNLKMNVSTSGDTYRQLVQKLNGRMVMIADKSTIQTGSLSFFTSDFISQLLKILKLKTDNMQKLDLNCAVVRADFLNGKASFPNGVAIDSEQLHLSSDGEVNLINDKIDFNIRPFAGNLSDASVAQLISSFIRIKGTTISPSITLDSEEAAKAAVGAIVGAPIYIGSKAVLDVNEAPCYAALQGTEFQTRFPAPTGVRAKTQDVYKDTTQAVKQSVNDLKTNTQTELKNLKSTAKDLLGAFKKPKKEQDVNE